MHHALEVHEILLNIFRQMERESSDLVALARTCGAFKEPALDILWEELYDLSPLARCLPEESRQLNPDHGYSFRRPLTQIQWDVLRNYARRIRSISIEDLDYGLDYESIASLSKPPASEPLFPNLRSLDFKYTPKDRTLLLLPLPSLVSLRVCLHHPYLFQESLKLFAKISPNIRELTIDTYHYAGIGVNKIIPEFIYWWRNLQTVACREVSLDVNTLLYLSRMPALTRLNFTLNDALPGQIPPSDSPLSFTNLNEFALRSKSLTSVSKLLSQTRLPAISCLSAVFEDRSSKQDIYSFFSSIQTSSIGHTIQELFVAQTFVWGRKYLSDSEDPKPVLGLEVLQPCMVFGALRSINFDIQHKMDLTDAELLTLASAWPRLEEFFINRGWGWRSVGITPNGLLQFLQKCPSLIRIALASDTRGYTELAQSWVSLGLTHARVSHVYVLDSFIEEESVPAISAFFTSIASRSEFYIIYGTAWGMGKSPDDDACEILWEDVYKRVKDTLEQPCLATFNSQHAETDMDSDQD